MTTPWNNLSSLITQLEHEGKVTRTFRRLDPERQQAVVDAILFEAGEKGIGALAVKEVAARAGVSVGSLYQYFGDRQGMLDFSVTLFTRHLLEMFEEGRPYLLAMPLPQALEAYLSTGVEWGERAAGMLRFFGRAAYQGDPDLAERVVRPVAETMRVIVGEMLQAAAERGELRPGLDVEAAARAVNALLIAAGDSQLFPYLDTYFQVTDERMGFQRVEKAVLSLILQGVAAPQANEKEKPDD